MPEAHRRLMNAGNDPTAFFIRSLPDAVLVFRGKGRPAVLLEFKDARTETSDHVFVRARADHNQSHQGTRLRNKADIFPIGKASLDAYQQLANIGLKIVGVGWQSWRDVDAADLRVQYVEHIDTCYVWEQDLLSYPFPSSPASASGSRHGVR